LEVEVVPAPSTDMGIVARYSRGTICSRNASRYRDRAQLRGRRPGLRWRSPIHDSMLSPRNFHGRKDGSFGPTT